jgi:NTE family protein
MPGLAIVLSGGGAKGAFQVGVLDELVTQRGVKFDIFAGVSTGAIQALGGAMNDIPGLMKVWSEIKGNGDIYKKRTFGVVEGLFGAPSLFTAKPLRDKLTAFANPAKLKAAKRTLRVGVVSLARGQYLDIDGTNPNIADWVYASCAQPPAFPPLETKDPVTGVVEQWVDGGVRNVAPLSPVMKLKPARVLVVLAAPPKPVPEPGKQYDSLLEIALRSVGIQTAEIVANDVGNAMLVNDLIAAREAQFHKLTDLGLSPADVGLVLRPLDDHLARFDFAPIRLIAPPMGFDAPETLEFKPAKIAAAIAEGQRVAKEQWPMIKAFLGV